MGPARAGYERGNARTVSEAFWHREKGYCEEGTRMRAEFTAKAVRSALAQKLSFGMEKATQERRTHQDKRGKGNK